MVREPALPDLPADRHAKGRPVASAACHRDGTGVKSDSGRRGSGKARAGMIGAGDYADHETSPPQTHPARSEATTTIGARRAGMTERAPANVASACGVGAPTAQTSSVLVMTAMILARESRLNSTRWAR